MGHQATREADCAAAIEQNLFGLYRLFKVWPRAQVYDGPELLWTTTDIQYPLFNSVLRARLTQADANPAIMAAVARAAAGGVPILWWTGPSTAPSDLARRLTSLGFGEESTMPGMALDLARPPRTRPPEKLVIEMVTSAAGFRTWTVTMASGFAYPDIVSSAFLDLYSYLAAPAQSSLAFYLGKLGGVPVGTSMLYQDSGVAGIHYVSTLSEFRGRGVGTAMTMAAVTVGRAAGCAFAVLEASPMGERIYHRLGFRTHCNIGQHLWPAACADQDAIGGPPKPEARS